MTFTTAHLSVSLDGYVAGPDQSLVDPIGRGGMDLHRWHLDSEGPQHVRTGARTLGVVRQGLAWLVG